MLRPIFSRDTYDVIIVGADAIATGLYETLKRETMARIGV